MMLQSLCMLLFLCRFQDSVDGWIRDLESDKAEVRDRAMQALIREYPKRSDRLHSALDAARELDLRARLREVVEGGKWLIRKEKCREALPQRILREYPSLVDELFSPVPDVAARAVAALGRTQERGPEDDPYWLLFLSPGEMARLLPYLSCLVRPGEAFLDVRREWARLLVARPSALESETGVSIARFLLKDLSEQARESTLSNLFEVAATREDILERLRRWEELDPELRRKTLQHGLRLGISELFAKSRELLQDPELKGTVVWATLWYQVSGLYPDVFDALKREPLLAAPLLIAKIGQPAVPYLRQRLADHPKDAAETVQALESIGSSEAADDVARLLATGTDPHPMETLRCLSIIGSLAQSPLVAQAVRYQIEIGQKKNDRWFPVKDAVALLTRWKASGEIVNLLDLVPFLLQQDVDIALIRLKPPGAAEKLAFHLRNPDAEIRWRALYLLGLLGAMEVARTHLDDVRAVLQAAKEDNAIDTIAQAIGNLGLRELIPDLLATTRRSQWVGRAFSVLWTSEERLEALRSPRGSHRSAAVYALKDDDWTKARDILPALARDPDPTVHWALSFMAQTGVLSPYPDVLRALVDDPDPYAGGQMAAVYLHFGKPDEKAMVDLLHHRHAPVRAKALGSLDPLVLSAQPALRATLEMDPEESVRDVLKARRLECVADPVCLRDLDQFLDRETSAPMLRRRFESLRRAGLGRAHAALPERFITRVLNSPPETIKDAFDNGGEWSQGIKVDLSRVLEEAIGLLLDLDPERAETVLLRMLDSDRADLQKLAIDSLVRIRCGKARTRLEELVPTGDGDAAAVALGELGAVPRRVLDHQDPRVRRRFFLAAAKARDPAVLDDVLRLYRLLGGDNDRVAISALAACVRPETASRLLEALLTPNASARQQVLWLLHSFPSIDLSDRVAEYLDDSDSHPAMAYLLEKGNTRYLETLLARARKTDSSVYAALVARFNLRGEIPELVRRVNAPVHESRWYLQATLEALATLGVREGMAAALRAAKTAPEYDRAKFVSLLPRMGRLDAVPALLELLRGTDLMVQGPAVRALAELGQEVFFPEMEPVLKRDWPSGDSVRAVCLLGARKFARDRWNEAERSGQRPEGSVAVAAFLNLEGARPRALELLQRNPEMMLQALREAWGEVHRPDRWLWHNGDVVWSIEDAIWRYGWEGHRTAIPGPSLTARELRQTAFVSWEGDVMDVQPGTWSHYIDEQGRLVVDYQERVISRWKARLSGK